MGFWNNFARKHPAAAKWIRDGYQSKPEEMIEYQLMCCPGILRPFLEPEERG